MEKAYRKALALNPNILSPARRRYLSEETSSAPAAGSRQLLPGQDLRHRRQDAGVAHCLPPQGPGGLASRDRKQLNEG